MSQGLHTLDLPTGTAGFTLTFSRSSSKRFSIYIFATTVYCIIRAVFFEEAFSTRLQATPGIRP
ncbi:hypothetical protein ASPFODRAFT_554210 [Aspergillus luchuensis CBS 106.47]|uniref:Uncharacterized protein n=1 Tax=Aspergillus luchuensis (strain CBS 106.47) TaxID=1137211 RepID=A0A1M3TQ45_ASPLC|nr:hypothetical protein ASPFODRAFT_554210 [Aspergillus luchuensis CBS 106.47]